MATKVVNKPPKTSSKGISKKNATGYSRTPSPKGGLKGGPKR